ncbi:hypothetical protein [Sporosarcina sp. HYO08]|uniref:hypothetical protein n=1 Tax=Sporosarcina sp. HYO08 TaxID=1759557 RepID=UPI0012E3E0B2|nr:hypothetical protein [Sporosarcina sp. HYO08]
MNSEYIKNSDPIQLQQMIIFLRAELAKYKHEVKKHKDDDYYYSLVEQLEQENSQLKKEQKVLKQKYYKSMKEFKVEANAYQEKIQTYEVQRKKYITSIHKLRNSANDVQLIHKQLAELTKQVEVALERNADRGENQGEQFSSLHEQLNIQHTAIEQFENKLLLLIHNKLEQTHEQIETLRLSNEGQLQIEKDRQLSQVIELKNRKIEELEETISNLSKQSEQLKNDRTRKQDEQVSTLNEQLSRQSTAIEQFEKKLIFLMRSKLEQTNEKIDALRVSNGEQVQFEKEQQLHQEIALKNERIEELERNITNFKVQNDQLRDQLANRESKQQNEQVLALREQLSQQQTTIEQFEEKLLLLIHNKIEQTHKQIDTLRASNEEKVQYEHERQLRHEIASKNERIEELERNISNLKKQSEQLKEDHIRKQDAQVSSLQEQLALQQATIEQFEEKLFSFIHDKLEQTNEQIDTFKNSKEDQIQYEKEKQQLREEIAGKNVKIEELQIDVFNLKEQSESLRNQLEENQNQAQNAQVLSLQEQLALQQATIEQFEGKLFSFIHDKLEQTNEQIDTFKNSKEDQIQYEKEKQQLREEIAGKNVKIEELQIDVFNLKEQSESLRNQLEENQNQAQNAQVLSLQEQLALQQATIEQFEGKLFSFIHDKLEQTNEQIDTFKNSKEDQIQHEKEKHQLREEIAVKNVEIAELHRDVSSLKEKSERLRDQLEEHRSQTQDAQVSSLHEQLILQQATIEQFEQKLTTLIHEKMAQARKQMSTLRLSKENQMQFEKAKEQLRRKIDRKNRKIEELEQNVKDLKEQCDQLRNQLEQSSNRLRELETLNAKQSDEPSELVIQLEQQIKTLLAKSFEYEEKLDAKILLVNDLEEKLDELAAELSELKRNDAVED